MDDVLYLVFSEKKREEIMSILVCPNPSHYQRLWMVGFLKWVGYNDDEVFDIIDTLNCWRDYDQRITKQQIRSVKVKRKWICCE